MNMKHLALPVLSDGKKKKTASYNWFKIDILRQLQPLTANYLAMFIVSSTTIHTYNKAHTKCKTRFHSQEMILNGLIGMWNSRPPPPSRKNPS